MNRAADLKQVIELASGLSALDKVRLVEQIMATLEQDLTSQTQVPKRSLYGLWTGTSLSSDEIDSFRQSLWANFPHEDE